MAAFKKLHANEKKLELFSRRYKKVIVMRSLIEFKNMLYDMFTYSDKIVEAWKET